VLNRPPGESLALLRVLLVPEKATEMEDEIMVTFSDGSSAGLALRHCVAVPSVGENANLSMTISHEHWAEILGGKMALSKALAEGFITTDDRNRIIRYFACFDLNTLNS
jgi:hypothetical protein